MFAIVVRFDCRDAEGAAAFDALVDDVLPGIRDDEPGTLVYTTHTVEGEPFARVFYEMYADRAAHAAHEARPGTARFLAAMREHVSAVRVELLESQAALLRPEPR